MKILVTGCAGFIGSHLCEQLLANGEEVIGVDNLNDYYDVELKKYNLSMLEPEERFIFLKDDIVTSNCINYYKPDKVVHLAAMAGVRYSLTNPNEYVRNNIMGTINLLNQCVNNNVQNFVYASSSSVYGLNNIPFSESDNLNKMNSHYAVSKKSVEDFCRLYNQLYNLNVIGLRFFTVYGPSCRPDMAPFKFLKNIIDEKDITVYGDGFSMRDYTYIDDIIDGIILALINKNNDKCEIYNLGNNNPIILNDFIKTCEKVCGKKAKIKYIENQKGDVPITFANIDKAKQNLGYNPKVNLEKGLTETYNWIKHIKI